MTGIAVGVVALLVAISTSFYFSIMSLLLWKLTMDGPETRKALTKPLMPAFFQNLGIPIAILGFSLRSTEMVVLAGLMIATAILLNSERTISLHPTIEVPMLGLALTALASIGLFYALV